MLICSELFAVGKSTIFVMLRDVVGALNQALKTEISWPRGDRLSTIAHDFHQLCGLPIVVGAIDGTHFAIAKPQLRSTDYFHFQTGAFTITYQAVVDSAKQFLDINVGMPRSTHNSRVLRRFALYHRGQHGELWLEQPVINGFTLYLLGDAGYPVLPWLMVPHRRHATLTPAQRIFNRKLSKGRAVVELICHTQANIPQVEPKIRLECGFLARRCGGLCSALQCPPPCLTRGSRGEYC